MGMSLFLSSAFMYLCGNVLLLSVPKVTVNNPDSDKGGGIAITNKNTYNEKNKTFTPYYNADEKIDLHKIFSKT